MDSIDKERYVGHWYEIYRDNWNMWTIGADCITKEFELNSDGDIDLYFRGNYLYAGYQGVKGKMYYCGEHGDSTCLATMGNSKHHGCPFHKKKNEKIPFNILDTD